ncbi:MAG: methionyl aminopeptidase [Solirubrobacteraceae bacterium]|jgi:methionyl aminopeptidase|nr:methionyl aminopeptidase [Solirubrobacteraceae bacterium]
MSVQTPEELAALRRAGRAVAATLREVGRRVRPGVTTAQLDAVAAGVLARHGARPAPALVYGFPGAICISVGDEAVHGIPGPRRLRAGELVTLDVTAELDGFYADAAVTLPVGTVAPRLRRLAGAAQAALRSGLWAARTGAPVNAIGAAVEAEARRRGCTVLGELTGHGIGRTIHEDPTVPNVYVAGLDAPLGEGAVITIEPILGLGGDALRVGGDGWTVLTADGSPTAHAEHTIVVSATEPIVLTATG